MAGIVDILLRIVGDNRDAVRSVDEVGTAAERSNERVGRLGETLGILAKQAGGIASAVVAMVAGFQEAAQKADSIFNREPQADVGLAGSPAETARALTSAGGTRFADLFDPSNFGRRGVLFGGRNEDAARRVQSSIDALATSNPEQLAAAIPFLPDWAAQYAADKLAQAQRARTFQQSLKPAAAGGGGHTVVVNTGVGDANRIGDEVAQALQRANRNNARQYSTTVTRG